jgi:hypothetical protein
MKRFSLILLFLLVVASVGIAQNTEPKIEVQKIWNEAPHSAFTDITRFKGKFYCTFREAPGHMSGPQGSARVIVSADEGKTWKSAALFTMPGLDLRDPKISITPDKRLMVLIDVETYADNKVYTRKPYVVFSDKNGENFSQPVESPVDPAIASKSDWVWRVTWHKKMGYAIDYKNGKVFLVKTKDGKSFDNVSQINIGGSPNEATVRFDKNNKAYVLIRREQEDKMGVLATAEAPYTNWAFNKLTERIGGPNFLFLNDTTLVIGSRLYPTDPQLQLKAINHKSAIFVTDLKGKIKKSITLAESGGDCSYPGMLIYKKMLWYAYYSSHEDKTSIYLAKVPLSLLK